MRAYAYDYSTNTEVLIEAAAIRLVDEYGGMYEIRLTGLREKNTVEISTPDDCGIIVSPVAKGSLKLQRIARPPKRSVERRLGHGRDERFKIPPPAAPYGFHHGSDAPGELRD